MKAYFPLKNSIEELVQALNAVSGDVSVVEPEGKYYGYYLKFFLSGAPGSYFVFFGDQTVMSSDSHDEIVCFLWGLHLGNWKGIRALKRTQTDESLPSLPETEEQ